MVDKCVGMWYVIGTSQELFWWFVVGRVVCIGDSRLEMDPEEWDPALANPAAGGPAASTSTLGD